MRNSWMSTWLLSSKTLALCLTLSAIFSVVRCGNSIEFSPSLKARSLQDSHRANGLAAFQNSFYAFARKNCVECHGANQNPKFAQADVNEAYRIAKPYADFEDFAQSVFVYRTMNGHCGLTCESDGTEMIGLIQQWWDGEKDPTAPPPVISKLTEPVALPSPLPEGEEFAVMQWNLSSLGPELKDAIFEAEIQLYNATAYRMRKPRLRTSQSPIAVENIGVGINGHFNPSANVYSTVRQRIAAKSAPVLSSANMLIPITPGNKISIRFKKLTPLWSVECDRSGLFQDTVFSILEARCANCHSGANTKGYSGYPMTNPFSTCRETMQRMDADYFTLSPLISYPVQKSNGHPLKPLSATELAVIKNWWETLGIHQSNLPQ